MSARPNRVAVLRHLIGLVLAVLLGLACLIAMAAAVLSIEWTLARDLGTLAAFAAVVVVLGAGEWLSAFMERICADKPTSGG